MISRKRGFTTLELLTATGIFSLILATTYGVLTVAQKSWRLGESRVETQEDARKALQFMVREIRESEQHQFAFMGVQDTDGYFPQMSFHLPLHNPDGTIQLGGVNNYDIQWDSLFIVYNQVGNQLIRTLGPTRVLANHIKRVQFRKQAATPDIVEIILTVEATSIKGEVTNQALHAYVTLRNKS